MRGAPAAWWAEAWPSALTKSRIAHRRPNRIDNGQPIDERSRRVDRQGTAELWDRWIELWNGDLSLAEQVIHPDFVVHRIPAPHVPEGLGGREALLEWVKATRSIIDGLRFT